MTKSDPLKLSVITSASTLSLQHLFQEVKEIHGEIVGFDLMILRKQDADAFKLTIPNGRITKLVAKCYDKIANKLKDQLADRTLYVPALATYFPDISSVVRERRDDAVEAIVNCVRLCHDLPEMKELKGKLTIKPCVEIVCGCLMKMVIVEVPDPQDKNKKVEKRWILEYDRAKKIDLLIDSLCRITKKLEGKNYALALELEPGESYVLNDDKALKAIYERVKKEQLENVVGLNLDIAHFQIAGISAEFLEKEKMYEWIVHSHIADHPPGMHTRDTAIGNFKNLKRTPTAYCEYLKLLHKRQRHYDTQLAKRKNDSAEPLLFTSAIAIELEGCSKMSWIHTSIPQLRQLLFRASEGTQPA